MTTPNGYNQELIDAARSWCAALCECAGCEDGYDEIFWNRLISSEGIFSEYIYYLINQNFACKYKIENVSLVDILVWQVDLFKAGMDMGRTERSNPDRLLLSAFEMMLNMEVNPEKYLSEYQNNTGTDYPGKY